MVDRIAINIGTKGLRSVVDNKMAGLRKKKRIFAFFKRIKTNVKLIPRALIFFIIQLLFCLLRRLSGVVDTTRQTHAPRP
ncbi:unnamed protein product [Brassica napus]|nr:unnamed protein product [Brassica napus]